MFWYESNKTRQTNDERHYEEIALNRRIYGTARCGVFVFGPAKQNQIQFHLFDTIHTARPSVEQDKARDNKLHFLRHFAAAMEYINGCCGELW